MSILLVPYLVLISCGPPYIPNTGGTNAPSSSETGPITVRITNSNPEVKIAAAQVVGTNETDSLDHGQLTFSACAAGQNISISAPGYYTTSLPCTGESPREYTISLNPLNAADNPNYAWIDAEVHSNSPLHCASCHQNPSSRLNEYVEWSRGRHAMALANRYFATTYTGTTDGKIRGENTLWNISPDGRRYRLPPNPTTNYGPGYRLDYPNEVGNCAACHAPAAAIATQQSGFLEELIFNSWGNHVNVASEGVTCDVCHKVTGVTLDEQKLPYMERPGILSFSFMRPAPGRLFVSGPGSRMGISTATTQQTCALVFSESEFCAPCHYAKFSGVEIYASYKEWLASSYSNKQSQSYRSCQDCHMSYAEPLGNSPADRAACSEGTPQRDYNHDMMKYGTDPDNPSRTIPLLVKQAAMVGIDQVSLDEGQVTFTVTVLNSGAGHKFPTDSPLRHLILLVEVKDLNNNPLTQVSGPIIPRVGDPEFAGYPGQIYANLLKDKDTNTIPAVDYWNPLEPAWQNSDTRLLPGVPLQSNYAFAAPANGSLVITARLIYRNVFSEIAEQKKWPIMDIEAAIARSVKEP